MITFEEFKSAINSLSKINNFIDNLEQITKLNISESDLVQETWKLFDLFINSHFTEEASDLIFWWIYEEVPKVIYQDSIFGKDEINVENIEDLWKYMISEKEIYFK